MLTDNFAHCDYQFLNALIGPAHALICLAHTPIRLPKLLGDPIEAFAGLPGQISDQFLQGNLILRDDLNDLLQTIYALSDGFFATMVLSHA